MKKKNFPPVKNNLEQQKIEGETLIRKNKKKQNKPLWNDNYKLINISYPESLVQNEKLKRKYKIKLIYSDEKGNKHNKTVRFGKYGKEDYLDNKNEENKKRLTSKLSNTHNLFHPNFWRLNILNSGDDLKKNWINLINKLSL